MQSNRTTHHLVSTLIMSENSTFTQQRVSDG
uniref:Uncharacterized protein n=1 Tax=Rhizophora mucronata TaxID=61149 RepID=A0A2P2QT81_RHIMU